MHAPLILAQAGSDRFALFVNGKLVLSLGGADSQDCIVATARQLSAALSYPLTFVTVPAFEHDEITWQERFEEVKSLADVGSILRQGAGTAPGKVYKLSHITDLVNLNEQDALLFAAEVPSMVAGLKLTKAAGEAEIKGYDLARSVPVLNFVADGRDEFLFRAQSGEQTAHDGAAVRAAAHRQKVSA